MWISRTLWFCLIWCFMWPLPTASLSFAQLFSPVTFSSRFLSLRFSSSALFSPFRPSLWTTFRSRLFLLLLAFCYTKRYTTQIFISRSTIKCSCGTKLPEFTSSVKFTAYLGSTAPRKPAISETPSSRSFSF